MIPMHSIVMANARKIVGSVLILVKVNSVNAQEMPKPQEFESPAVAKTIPCEVVGGKYYDLRTGEQLVGFTPDEVWAAQVGSVFCYPDGKMFLLTRYINGDRGIGEITEGDFMSINMRRCPVK